MLHYGMKMLMENYIENCQRENAFWMIDELDARDNLHNSNQYIGKYLQ